MSFFCRNCNDLLRITINEKYDEKNVVNVEIGDLKGLQINDNKMYNLLFSYRTIRELNASDEEKKALIKKMTEIIESGRTRSKFIYKCSSCLSKYYIQQGAIIDTANYKQKREQKDVSAEIRKQDPTLYRTKNYVCMNAVCITNTDESMGKKKEAVFYTLGDTYNIRYICTVCNTQWGT